MRAFVAQPGGGGAVEEVPDPKLTGGQVLVAIEWGGICGSDISYWRRGATGTAVIEVPLILGHEVAGTVVDVGSYTSREWIGQRVALYPARAEGSGGLPERLAGRTNLLPRVRYLGSAALQPQTDGGFAELVAVPVEQLRLLPIGLSSRHGAVAEPLAVAMHAVSRAGDLTGRHVLVHGCGPIGLLAIAAARRAGAAKVTGVDVSRQALDLAIAMRADAVIDARAESFAEVEAEVVIEATGIQATLGEVLLGTARGGTVVQVGNLPAVPTPAALGQLVTREITWIGSYRFVAEMDDALVAMADGLDVDPILTHTFDLADGQRALETAADRETGSSKVMLRIAREAA